MLSLLFNFKFDFHFFFVFFFFQAEDGIRDATVTGVQTCALPILRSRTELALGREVMGQLGSRAYPELPVDAAEVRLDGLRTEEEGGGHLLVGGARSEERRVGKECRGRGGQQRAREESSERLRESR